MPFAPSVMPDAGSPPRVRGKGQSKGREQRELRITPACAGKSNTKNAIKSIGRDHPRVCGEKVRIKPRKTWEEGSPPRVRGKGRQAVRHAHAGGITPACAGKSASQGSRRCPQRDHPRVCGEKECLWHGLHYGWRITPACAGKRPSARTCRIASGDHPRVCGEKADGNRQRGFCEGSPPRVRGKGFPSIHIRRVDGITPACAGKRF